ncbi:hypothetical protein KBB96_18685 [Luteolibacter ambystomatis]|uniref:Uncharacterized protein n=1 Tax=Luteolibacter ambystomatis TaxID=2824561 RepID=A0A975G869_9BACT|nr:hypothetical protein [Luteolibacter ambystomatis]QUE50874.1 hypothetical protein KBB96_18685 [Luteolibacter ambystomatis]
MTKKTALIASAAAIVAGAGICALLQPSAATKNNTVPSLATSRDKSVTDPGKGDGSSAPGRANRERPATTLWPDLAAKYGESRTNLSRHTIDGFLGLLDEVLVLAESADDLGTLAGKKPGDDPDLGDLPEKLKLTAEQKAAAAKLVAESQKRQVEELRKLSSDLRKEPKPLVELALVADAAARKQITQEEYQAKVKEVDAALKSSLGRPSLKLQAGNGGDQDALLRDPTARAGFEKLLDPTQSEAFQEMVAAQPQGENPEESIADTFKPMELEKLDQTLTSTKSMMEGVRKMMEGMKTLPKEAQ